MNPEAKKSETSRKEEVTQKFWEENRIFEKSVAKPAPQGDYVFYDGPPFATGLPHYGHIVASVIKDVVPRYFTMQGYRVPRVWGWDCHGLPIENIVEKELGFKHKKDIKEFGIAKFNEQCRARVLTFAAEWEKIIPRIGRWADMKNAYRTMDKPFMESVWWVFKQIYDKGLVYEDYRSMHICPRCETTLSQQEVSEGYKDVKDIAVTVKFKLKNPAKIGLTGDVYMLAWTTTPWTLPGNVALAVGNDIEYLAVPHDAMPAGRQGSTPLDTGNATYIYAKDRFFAVSHVLLPKRFDEFTAQKITQEELFASNTIFKGSELVGLEYEPPFDYYVNDENLKNRENGWKVYAADFVTADSGTGIAHEAPAFGADDWELLKQVNLPFVQHVNYDGTMKPEVKDFAGMEVKPRSDDDKVRLGTDIAVLKFLQESGALFAKENITHSYPHCWRCDTPLLNYATSSWFVSVVKIKENLLENAKNVSWSPEHIKEGRFGKWLEGARDWSISRQRFWASVIPIWVCEKCKMKTVFGSAEELERVSGKKVDDLHKHIVDEITYTCSCGGTMKRIPDVLDTWFDSGSMPYGSKHYPFENKEQFDAVFPAQFIAEGLDQTRAWFYYLHVLSGALFQKNAFQNVIVNGIVLAEDGKKMSKKLNNYPDPMMIVNTYSADALRLYLLSSPVMQAENLAFSEKGVDEWQKKVILRLENVVAFYALYKNELAYEASAESKNILDRWMFARMAQTHKNITEAMEKYQLDTATRQFSDLIDDLSTWYLRRSRERFKEEDLDDKKAALSTLLFILHETAKLLAPFAPFLAERLWQDVKTSFDPESVHLAQWSPEAIPDDEIISSMRTTRVIASQALEARSRASIPVRQALASISVKNSAELSAEYRALLLDEVNVKDVRFDPNQTEDIILDTTMTPELLEEGLVRESTRAIQAARKTAGLSVGDVITIIVSGPKQIIQATEKNKAAIEKQTSVHITEFEEGDELAVSIQS